MSPRARNSLLGTCVLLTTVCGPGLRPSGANAGQTVRSGNETLTLKVAATVLAKAKNRRGARLRIIFERGTVDGQRSRQRLRSITITGPRGLRYNPGAFPRCLLSAWVLSEDFSCPTKFRIGFGTGAADGRPTIPQLVQLPVNVFNASNDVDGLNRPRAKPLPGVILATGSVGAALDIIRPGGLYYEQPDEDPEAAFLTLVRLDLTVKAISRRGTPYVQLPAKCPRSRRWRFTATERHYEGPTLKATHDVRCRRR